MKKFLALVLVTVLTLSLSANVFAAENGENIQPENAKTHTIEMTIEPGEEYGIMPCMWDTKNETVSSTFTTDYFTVDSPFFAYETSATSQTGGSASGTYRVEFMTKSGGVISSVQMSINGVTHKEDWIPVDVNGQYKFKLYNFSNTTIIISLTYYSFNS